MNNPEQELLLAARQFEMDALAAIFDRYHPKLYNYAVRLLGDPILAEDCVADPAQLSYKVTLLIVYMKDGDVIFLYEVFETLRDLR